MVHYPVMKRCFDFAQHDIRERGLQIQATEILNLKFLNLPSRRITNPAGRGRGGTGS